MAKKTMDRNLALEVVRVTEAAALAASRLMGRGDEKAADQAAVDAMRRALNGLAIDGTVVIGEGERDEAPMLYHRREGGRRRAAGRHRARSRSKARRSPPRAAPTRSPSWRWRRRAASSTRPTSTWTRSRSAAACRMAWSISTTSRKQNLREPGQGQEGRGGRHRRLHPRPAAPCRADRAGARGGRAHHADLRRRRQRRDRHLAAGQRRRHLSGHRRRARGRAGGRGAALHRRPDAGPAAVPQRRRARPRHAAGASPISTANTACSTWPRAT